MIMLNLYNKEKKIKKINIKNQMKLKQKQEYIKDQ